MDKIIIYILIALTLFFVLQAVIKIFAFYWKAGYENRRKQREKKKQEQLKWQYAKVSSNNWLLENITQSRFIIFRGGWGKGKSILMNLVAHYLWTKEQTNFNNNLRYNQVMRPEYTKEYFKLIQDNKLPIYSNLDFILKTQDKKLNSQELDPYIKLQKKAIQKAVFCIDEFSSLFPKEMYYDNLANNNPKIVEMEEFFKKNRHYTNGWILGTEQDGEDMYKGFRKNGYALVTALGTSTHLPHKAKFIRSFKNCFNTIAPAFFTTNVKQLFNEQLFIKDKFLLFFKLLLPSYCLLPKCYYQRKQEINNQIKEQYQQFITLIDFEGKQYYLRYTNNDIFDYNTRAYKHEYDDKFDKDGNRKVIDNE